MLEIVIVVLALAALPLLATCIVITRQQHVRFIETFGRYSTTRRAGLSLKWPAPIQVATANFSLKIQEIAQDISVKSSDNAFVVIPIRVQYAATASRASDAFYRLEDPENQLASYVVNQVRATAAGMEFSELFSAKNRFEEDVAETLTDRLGDYGLEARASKEAMVLKAEGYAQFREIIAKGNSTALAEFVGETGLSA